MNTFLRPKQAAQYLNIGVSTLWKWNKENPNFPERIKLGERVTVWRKSDLDNFVNQKQKG